jgi:hypothetical protein
MEKYLLFADQYRCVVYLNFFYLHLLPYEYHDIWIIFYYLYPFCLHNIFLVLLYSFYFYLCINIILLKFLINFFKN